MDNSNNKNKIYNNKDKLQIIFLGGLDGIGKNMQAVKYKDEIIVIDSGMMFPDETMLGIDMVIPDFTYLRENKDKVKATILTHGHEDHIGSLRFLYDEIDAPIYATKLTMGLAENKLSYPKRQKITRNIIKARDKIKIGSFIVEFVNVNHSIPDGVGLIIKTPAGNIVHTGDFKIDYTPIDGKVIDLNSFANAGREGVLALLSDSTNAGEAGHTMSERVVGESLENIFRQSKGRIIIATFASNIHRIQQIINVSKKFQRKFVFMGKSIEENLAIAYKLGYVKYKEQDKITFEEAKKIRANHLTVITTGSQGEPMSALTKMANQEFKHLNIVKDDTIIISAIPIPGNEKAVTRNVNKLFKIGANVISEADYNIHVSGHAKIEEQKTMISIVKPKYFIPVHGEYRHLKYHAKIAEELGIAKDKILIPENGNIVELSELDAKIISNEGNEAILVDGLGRIDKDNSVLKERQILSKEGFISVTTIISDRAQKVIDKPVIKSRGFAYLKESDEIISKTASATIKKLNEIIKKEGTSDLVKIRLIMKNHLREFLYQITHRRPMILFVVLKTD